MIKAKNGKCTIKCKDVAEMMADFTGVCTGIYQILKSDELERGEAKEFMSHCLDIACCESTAERVEIMFDKLLELNERQEEAKGEDHE